MSSSVETRTPLTAGGPRGSGASVDHDLGGGRPAVRVPSTGRLAALLASDGPAVAPPDEGGSASDHELRRGALPESLTSLLWRREQVARCSAALAAYLGVEVERAEVLLLSEAQLRQVPVGELARAARGHTSPARRWKVAQCPVCHAAGRLQVSGGFALDRVVVCPSGHGVMCSGLAVEVL